MAHTGGGKAGGGGGAAPHPLAAPPGHAKATGSFVSASSGPSCPVDHGSSDTGSGPAGGAGGAAGKAVAYDVYGQPVDPSNAMPTNPNQSPSSGQVKPLSTHRVTSSIPKGGTEGTWAYPSPQMFFNALRRKGKGTDVREDDVPTIVAVHNNMNERAWRELERWEALHAETAGSARLLRFRGRPDELSPKARLKALLGWGTPFDRHDWVVVRGDGSEVRYIIDYYYDDRLSEQDAVPALHSSNAVRSISMDVRPAVDSASAALDRLRRLPERCVEAWHNWGERQSPSAVGEQDGVEKAPVGDAPEEFTPLQKVQVKCAARHEDVAACSDEESCAAASLALDVCVAGVVCPDRATAFISALEKGADAEQAYEAVGDCIAQFRDNEGNA